jgi:hypothetical protein
MNDKKKNKKIKKQNRYIRNLKMPFFQKINLSIIFIFAILNPAKK